MICNHGDVITLWKVLQHLVKNSCYSDDVSHDAKDSLYDKTLTLLARVTSQVVL